MRTVYTLRYNAVTNSWETAGMAVPASRLRDTYPHWRAGTGVDVQNGARLELCADWLGAFYHIPPVTNIQSLRVVVTDEQEANTVWFGMPAQVDHNDLHMLIGNDTVFSVSCPAALFVMVKTWTAGGRTMSTAVEYRPTAGGVWVRASLVAEPKPPT